ncbi:type 1 glutamine amidotransferase [Flavobacterium subsaxonicum]|uniref:Amidotransferase n=1 Tax=Flavobacterium subsaxonicum WB 4.1-42 = DSM 21790 TaxID=1121898 RepID=A0A0A2MGP3_9FLAO|nr:type 1 glutamine amidotransferase [Flavobacterium subsaxonicum]KGO91842.1 amidotransferase [Flavobacterium subsaxonicum WB 4.1-42 = DSM 21790]
MNIHIFQHVSFEGPGYITNWAEDNGHTVTATHFYEAYTLPDLNAIDWLIVMGGPMGVYQEDMYEWLAAEKAFIKKAIAAGKTVVGICLGSQLIAEVLDAEVYPNNQKEIGWFPVRATQEGKNHPLLKGIDLTAPVFHWHGDTFNLPPDATLLLVSEACKNQAFVYKDKVLGLQFHLEATPESLQLMVQHGLEELVPGTYIETAEAILANANLTRNTNAILSKLFTRLSNS